MTTTPADAPRKGIDKGLMRTAIILIVGALAVVFDSTIVSVAIHQLTDAFNAPLSTVQWVSTGYLLAMAVLVPLSTWGIDRFGGKNLWLIALTIFFIGSIGSSLSWSIGSLIVWRIIQGLGGGIMMPLLTTILMRQAGGKALGKTLAVVSFPALLGPVLGPLIGGAIITWLKWRYIFWVNVPFCVVGFILALLLLPKDKPAPGAKRAHLDWIGFILLSPAIALVILGLSNAGSAAGFIHPDVIWPLALGAAFLLAFVLYSLRVKEPLVNLKVLVKRSVGSSSTVLFFAGFALYGAMFLLPLFFQTNPQQMPHWFTSWLGVNALPLWAGILMIPQGIGNLISRQIAGGLTDKIGGRWVAATGFVIVTFTTIPFAFVNANSNIWWLCVWMLLRGIGLGAVMIPVMSVAYIGLDRADIGHATVLTRTIQQIGNSFGTAIAAVVLESALVTHVHNPSGAFDIAFWWTIGFSAFAVVLCLWLPSLHASKKPVAGSGSAPASPGSAAAPAAAASASQAREAVKA